MTKKTPCCEYAEQNKYAYNRYKTKLLGALDVLCLSVVESKSYGKQRKIQEQSICLLKEFIENRL